MQTILSDKAFPATWQQRKQERGAALISTLLLSMMLLTAGGALILTTSMSATNSYDATSEMQAYYAAEAGVQATINILRGHDFAAGAPTDASFPRVSDPNALGANSPDVNLSRWRGSSSPTAIPGSISTYQISLVPASSNSSRLVIDVDGNGPRGARKRLRVMLAQYSNIPLNVPAPIVLPNSVGNASASVAIGNSNANSYTGNDAARPGDPGYSASLVGNAPAFAVLNQDVASTIQDFGNRAGDVTGTPTAVAPLGSGLHGTVLTPSWLTDATAARAEINLLRASAQTGFNGAQYFNTTAGQTATVSNSTFTFVDGNLTLSGSHTGGSGLLVVTGTLTLNGNVSFDGLILVLGGGNVQRNGGGNGTVSGGIVAANVPSSGSTFGVPIFDTSGGGDSTIQYNSAAINNANSFLGGVQVMGVTEQ